MGEEEDKESRASDMEDEVGHFAKGTLLRNTLLRNTLLRNTLLRHTLLALY